MKSGLAIAFDFSPSRYVEYALIAVMGLALVASFFSASPHAGVVRGLVTIAALVPAARHARLGRWRVAWREDGTWGVVDAQSVASEATLAGWRRIGHGLVLRLRLDSGRRLPLILLPDNVDADTRRRLVARLVRGDAAQAPDDVSLLQ